MTTNVSPHPAGPRVGRGLVFDIQRFSVHNGPGIRTTVFMKGCPLTCLWCSNPESQDFFANLLARDVRCRGCGACVEACPRRAITVADGGRTIDWARCNHCMECVASCIYGSLTACGEYMDVDEIVAEVIRDRDFYETSGGGATISGGEALVQDDFVLSVLRECKKEGLHTALDTTGYATWEKLEKLLPFVDLVLFDIKHLDPAEHKRATGVGNRVILENLERVADSRPTWLRMPVIPGFNDSEDHAGRLGALGKRVGAEKIALLPYHEGGAKKSEQVGKVYGFSQSETPDDHHVQKLRDIIEAQDLRVSVGN
jgi:pyruvate formate lyase activating enzyme